MEIKCFEPTCSETPILFCACTKDFTMFCSDHIQTHVLINESLDHTCKPIYKKVDEVKRKAIVVKSQEILSKIKSIKQLFTREHSKAVEHLEKIKSVFLSNFKRSKETYKKILADTRSLDRILGFPGEKSNKYIDADLEMISKLIEEAHPILPSPKYVEPQTNFLENYSKSLFIAEFEKEQPSSFIDTLHFFKGESKTLVELNVESLERVETEVNLPENLGLLASICMIPGGKLFYNGGYSGEGDVIASTYIVNLKTKDIEILPKCRLRCTAAALYHMGCVYIFGGFGKVACKNSDKFTLKGRSWGEISDLPSPMQNSSTVVVKNTIVISGLGSSIYQYNVETDSYKVLISTLYIGSFNILIKETTSIYLLSAGIFLSTEETLDKWLYTEKISEIISSTTCRPVIKDRFAYFLCQDGEIMKFNLDTLELIKIKQLYF